MIAAGACPEAFSPRPECGADRGFGAVTRFAGDQRLLLRAADVELRVLPGVGHHIASVEMETYVMKFFDRVLGRA